jgi:HK97 family phage prohead protease
MLERRSFTLEVRAKAEGDDDGKLTGYAAVFDTLSHPIRDMWGDSFFEEIKPGAFSRTLREKGHDVLALWCHDMAKPLASRDAGSLDLVEDDTGLGFIMRVNQSMSWARDAVTAVREKLVRKMSFGFNVRGEEWLKKVDGKMVRSLTDVDLFEVSPVALPAYEGTEVEARSAIESYKQFLAKDERSLSEAKTKAAARFIFARARSNARRLA